MNEKLWRQTTNKREEGQGLLEFALIFTLLMMLLFGIIDFSRIFFAYATMSHGAREGTRYGIIHPGNPTNPGDPANQQIIQIVENRMFVLGGDPEVELSYPDGCATSLCPIQIHVTSSMDVWTPIIPEITIEARSTMHIE